jgi:hypothetical protein
MSAPCVTGACGGADRSLRRLRPRARAWRRVDRAIPASRRRAARPKGSASAPRLEHRAPRRRSSGRPAPPRAPAAPRRGRRSGRRAPQQAASSRPSKCDRRRPRGHDGTGEIGHNSVKNGRGATTWRTGAIPFVQLAVLGLAATREAGVQGVRPVGGSDRSVLGARACCFARLAEARAAALPMQ